MASSVQRMLHTAARALSMPAGFTAIYDAEGRLAIHSWYGFDTSASQDSGFLAADYSNQEGVFEVHDATHDTAFAHDIWVTNGGVRFFACAPITTPNKAHLGIVAVLDSEPRTLTSDQTRLLNEFSHLISESIMLRLESSLMKQTASNAERSKNHLEKRLNRMVSSLPVPLFAVDRQGEIMSWNRACADRFGYAPEEVVGQSMLDLLVPEDDRTRIDTLIGRVYNRRRISGITLTLRDRKKKALPVLCRLFPFFNPEGLVEACVFIHSDAPATRIARVNGERAEKKCGDAALELETLKSTFLDNLSHEMRTPLTSIIGFSEILNEHVDESNRQFTRLIESSAQQLMETLTAVLDLAQLKSHALEIKPQSFDLLNHAHTMVGEFAERAAVRDLYIDVACETGDQSMAFVDPDCHTRIMRHLLDNAIKYTRKGGVSIRFEATATHTILRVSDTGIGIGKDFLAHLFDEFVQESRGLSRAYQGTGLGLAITRRLVEIMGGTIQVESKRGEGSTFTVTYPKTSAVVNRVL